MTYQSPQDPLHEHDLYPHALALSNQISYIISMLDYLSTLLFMVGKCGIDHMFHSLQKVKKVVIDILSAFDSVRRDIYYSLGV
jgi:hypothetical protein